MRFRPKAMLSTMLLLILSVFCIALQPVKAQAAEYNEANIRQTALYMMYQCMQTDDETFELLQEQRETDLDFALLQNGIPCGGKDYLAILSAWRDGEEECGAFRAEQDPADLINSFELKERNGEVELTGEVMFEERGAEVTFTFEPDGTVTALTVGGHYAIGEVMRKAGQNTLIGMGTVFAVLVFMSLVISSFNLINKAQGKKRTAVKKKKNQSESNAKIQAVINEEIDEETLSVIAAAISRDLRDYPLKKEEGNMRIYNIKVNGKTYEVEVEEVGASLTGHIRPASAPVVVAPAAAAKPAPAAAPAPAPKPAPAAAPAPAPAPAPAGAAGSAEITSGVAGKVFQITASAGQAVKAGDTVMVLEAMKMEIPIVAPADGTVAEIKVAVGDAVETGQVLATLS